MSAVGDTLVNRYALRARLGGGGLGEVFVARDLRSDREVAVKVLDVASVPAERLTRWTGLLRVAMRVEHPVVMLPRIQVGTVESPPVLVSDMVAGEDLAGLLRRVGPLPWQRALAIVHALTEGLCALAEATGAAHRALKPGNVRVTPEDEVRLLDFGIAELGVQPVPPREDGSVAEYRAPEQLAGSPGDASSDVFTLGVLLFELTTGVHPFTGPSAFKAARSVLTRQAAPRPAELAAATPLPSQVEALIVRALAPRPSQRFHDVAELARHLALIRRSPGTTPRTRGAPAPGAVVDEEPTQRHEAPVSLDDRTTIVSLGSEGPRGAGQTVNERTGGANGSAPGSSAELAPTANARTGRAAANGSAAGSSAELAPPANASTGRAANGSTAGSASPSQEGTSAANERTLALAVNGGPLGAAPVDATVVDRTVADLVERPEGLRGGREETLVLPASQPGDSAGVRPVAVPRAPAAVRSADDDPTVIVLPEAGSAAPARTDRARADLVDRTVHARTPVGAAAPTAASMPARWRQSPLLWPGLMCALSVALALIALWTFART